MKLFGHPIHVMLIHFPAALFPMELVCYSIFYNTGNQSFGEAAYYATCGGALLGLLAIVTGAIDLVMISDNDSLQSKALVHGAVNSIVVIGYAMLALYLYKQYPNLPIATMPMLALRAALNMLAIGGNYLGGNLILKYRVGVQKNSKIP